MLFGVAGHVVGGVFFGCFKDRVVLNALPSNCIYRITYGNKSINIFEMRNNEVENSCTCTVVLTLFWCTTRYTIVDQSINQSTPSYKKHPSMNGSKNK